MCRVRGTCAHKDKKAKLRMFTRIPVPQGVARKLQTMILDGELKTGEKIPSQRELSEKFGVSRASLRNNM